jgi:hypothetical protein
MYIIFDENVPIKIPEALRLLDATCNYYEIHTINELGLLGEKDIDLFPKLKQKAEEKHKKCILITGDVNIFKRKPELQAFKNNKLVAFVLPPSYSNYPLWNRSVYILHLWKALIEIASKAKEADIFKLPPYSKELSAKAILNYQRQFNRKYKK